MRITRQRLVVLGVVSILVCSAAIVYGFVCGCANVYKMPVSAMEPTIKAGESIRANMSAYEHADPQRWDVVVLRAPLNREQHWVFRIVAMPGETVSSTESGLSIDGRPVDMPDQLARITYKALNAEVDSVDHPLVVAPNCYYVLGDNSAKANDSRVFGAIEREDILGKVEGR